MTCQETHISSLIVHALASSADEVAATIDSWAGCEVRGASPDGKLVVVMEAEDGRELLARIDRINQLHGVLNSALVFHHCEPTAALTEDK